MNTLVLESLPAFRNVAPLPCLERARPGTISPAQAMAHAAAPGGRGHGGIEVAEPNKAGGERPRGDGSHMECQNLAVRPHCRGLALRAPAALRVEPLAHPLQVEGPEDWPDGLQAAESPEEPGRVGVSVLVWGHVVPDHLPEAAPAMVAAEPLEEVLQLLALGLPDVALPRSRQRGGSVSARIPQIARHDSPKAPPHRGVESHPESRVESHPVPVLGVHETRSN